MKFSTKLLGIVAVSVIMVACGSNPVTETMKSVKSVGKMDSSVGAAIKAAKAAKKKSAAADAEWRDMGKYIKKAEKLAKSGKNAEALKLANKVVKQGELGLAQAAAQANAGPNF
jgi:predicted transcriptional regulator